MSTPDELKRLAYPESVRRRPGMYIGGANSRGLHNCAFELLENAVDEFMAGHCSSIIVQLEPDGSLSVADNGRGIPIANHPDFGVSTLEVVASKLFSSPMIVNALSEWFHITVMCDGGVWEQKYERGYKKSEVVRTGNCSEHGTRITFRPDEAVFKGNEFDATELDRRCSELAFLNSGIIIDFDNRRNSTRSRHFYLGGVAEYLRKANADAEQVHEVIGVSDFVGDTCVELAFQYLFNETDGVRSYANNYPTSGGTHVDGLLAALIKFFGAGPIGEATLGRGLSAIISVKLPNPDYARPDRFVIGNSEALIAVQALTLKSLQLLDTANSPTTDAIRKKIESNVGKL